MSVRMALAKLSACAAGCAIIGGGAVHVAEKPSKEVQYRKVKMVKGEAPVRTVKHVVHKDKPRMVKRVRKIVKRTCCEAPQMAMVPLPAPYIPPAPPEMPSGGAGGI